MESKDKSLLQTYLVHRTRLHALATRIVGCHAKGEDIVQEAYLRLHTETPPGERAIKRPFQYLWSVVYRLSVDARREAARKPVFIAISSPPDSRGTEPSPVIGHEPVDPLTPERDLAAREALERVMQVLDVLPPRTRKAYELNQIHGFTQREVATTLGVSPPRVSMMIKEAARRLNDAFGDED